MSIDGFLGSGNAERSVSLLFSFFLSCSCCIRQALLACLLARMRACICKYMCSFHFLGTDIIPVSGWIEQKERDWEHVRNSNTWPNLSQFESLKIRRSSKLVQFRKVVRRILMLQNFERVGRVCTRWLQSYKTGRIVFFPIILWDARKVRKGWKDRWHAMDEQLWPELLRHWFPEGN